MSCAGATCCNSDGERVESVRGKHFRRRDLKREMRNAPAASAELDEHDAQLDQQIKEATYLAGMSGGGRVPVLNKSDREELEKLLVSECASLTSNEAAIRPQQWPGNVLQEAPLEAIHRKFWSHFW